MAVLGKLQIFKQQANGWTMLVFHNDQNGSREDVLVEQYINIANINLVMDQVKNSAVTIPGVIDKVLISIPAKDAP
jgi:hypothetical protein